MKEFSLKDYPQSINVFFNSADANFDKNLLSDSYQEHRLTELKHSYFGTASRDNSPWSQTYIELILSQQTNSDSLLTVNNHYYDTYNNYDTKPKNKLVYGKNNKLYVNNWLNKIKQNIDFDSLVNIKYSASKRAIMINNGYIRALPTDLPAYYNSNIAGEGKPFDYFQLSAIYAGTPVYILGHSVDEKWCLIMSPEYIGWVKAKYIAKASNDFIKFWQQKAYANLAGITINNVKLNFQAQSSLESKFHSKYITAYVGMILPLASQHKSKLTLMLPILGANGDAEVGLVNLPQNTASILPLSASKSNFALILKSQQGRAYGWGGVNFNNDCSSEMKSLFTMFGFFLPRNTTHQALAGVADDITKLSPSERLNYLIKNGVPLLTLVHIKGHVLLYLGTYKTKDGDMVAMSYQEKWGIVSKDGNSRSIINASVFMPLLLDYPEDDTLSTEAHSKLFELIYLNKFPDEKLKQTFNDLVS
ncbi:MAG: SH3 domain-containing protein [Burkholderiales bacterium]|nr:SH3 domain-containing protein [Burkholderiales bacterium]